MDEYLPVNQVSVHQSVLQQWSDSVDVVFAHLSNILEQETKTLENTILYIEFRYSVNQWEISIIVCVNQSEGSIYLYSFIRPGSTVKGEQVSATIAMATWQPIRD